MVIKWKLNNYQVGSKYRLTPTHKVILSEKIDKTHTIVGYEGLTNNEIKFIRKVYGKKEMEA